MGFGFSMVVETIVVATTVAGRANVVVVVGLADNGRVDLRLILALGLVSLV